MSEIQRIYTRYIDLLKKKINLPNRETRIEELHWVIFEVFKMSEQKPCKYWGHCPFGSSDFGGYTVCQGVDCPSYMEAEE